MVVAVDGEAFPFDAAFDGLVHGFEKIIAMRLDVETDQIGAEQAVEQFALPGTNREGFRIGPGNVPENRDASVGPRGLDQPRQQREVIILNQHERRFGGFDFLQHGLREFFVDALVVLPIGGAETRTRVGDVAERPNAFVGEAEVVAVFLFLGEPDAAQRVMRMVGRDAQAVVLVHGFAVGVGGAVGDPRAVASVEDGFERGDQAAGGNLHFDSLLRRGRADRVRDSKPRKASCRAIFSAGLRAGARRSSACRRRRAGGLPALRPCALRPGFGRARQLQR